MLHWETFLFCVNYTLSMKEGYTFSEISALRIHIAPVGFEFDRVIIPIKTNKADRVWLLRHAPDKEPTLKYLERIRQELKKEKIECKVAETDLFDLTAVLQQTHEILQKEKNHRVYVNISSGSKVTAIALALACMIWGGIPYYVKPIEYASLNSHETISKGVKDIVEVPKFNIHKPDSKHLDVLKIISNAKGKIKRKILLEELIMNGKIKSGISDQAKYNFMNRNYLKPLLDKNYIELSNSIIVLTEQGKNTLKIFNE